MKNTDLKQKYIYDQSIIDKCAQGLADRIDREIMEEYLGRKLKKTDAELYLNGISKSIMDEGRKNNEQ